MRMGLAVVEAGTVRCRAWVRDAKYMSMSCEFVNIAILPYATRAPTRRKPRFGWRRG
jgi:hypothetical protein